MRRALGRTWQALLVLACIAYQYLVHTAIGDGQSGLLHSVLLWLPLAALAVWILARSRNKPLWLAVLAAGSVVVSLTQNAESLGLVAVSGLSHATAYLFLLWYFGRTLARGREPVITRYARRVHGGLLPGMERFTHGLTIAWCVFFAAQLVASALLLAFAPLDAWSLFVNLLNLPLVALMFAGQWVYRGLRHPDWPRASAWRAIEAFTQDASLSGSAEVR